METGEPITGTVTGGIPIEEYLIERFLQCY